MVTTSKRVTLFLAIFEECQLSDQVKTSTYNQPCEGSIEGQAIETKTEALLRQSIELTFPFIPKDRETQREIKRCLYGSSGAAPWKNRLINGIHQLLTLICLFLFGLAVRNRFKIT